MMGILRPLLEMTIMASVLIGVILIIRMSMSKKMNPVVMLLLWAMVLVRLSLPVTFASPVHLADLMPEQTAVEQAKDSLPAATMPETGKAPVAQNPRVPANVQSPTIGNSVTTKTVELSFVETIGALLKRIPIWSVVAVIWAFGAIWVLLSTIRKAWLFRKKLRLCKHITDDGILQSIECHKRNLGTNKRIIVLECNFIQAPAVFGYLKPHILLPTRFLKQMDKSGLNSILLHEICHIRRHDILMNYVWLLAKAVHWFNPLVWIAYRLYQDDVEMCRDQMVVHYLGEDDRLTYSQSLIEAVRFSRRNISLVPSVATSLFENKSKLKERVIRLVRPQKKSKSVATITLFLATVMIFTCFTTACQPTPEKPIVVGKQDGIEQKITDNNGAASLSGIPATLQDTYTQGKVTVNLDAKVDIPQTDKIPVVKTIPEGFTQEMVDKVIATLMQGKPIWEPKTVQTKEELQRQLVYFKALLEKGGEKSKEKYESVIKETENAIAAAPETVDRKVSSGKLTDVKPEDVKVPDGEKPKPVFNGQGLTVEANLGQEYNAILYVSTSDSGKTANLWFGHRDVSGPFYDIASSIPAGTAADMRMTLDDARNMAVKAVQDMGCDLELADMRVAADTGLLSDDTNPHQAYVFFFTRMASGVPTTFDIADGASMDWPEGEAANYFEPYPYERMYIVVDDTGIVELNWVSSMKLTDTVSENAKLLSFDEVMDIFKTQYFIRNALKVNGQIEQYPAIPENSNPTPVLVDKNYVYTADITRITLGLIRLPVKDRPDEYTLIPVWDFFGTEHVEYNEQYTDETGQTKTSDDFDRTMKSFLTVNAIDGSIVDRG